MCGIFGSISDDAAAEVLEGLRKLEYRGYDSAGLAALFQDHEGPIETERTTGYVSDLVSKANGRFRDARISIGHTRWATHGGVSDSNAHPHSSNDGKISIVHNGIIENASQLLQRVTKLGYEVTSETDSELIVHLLDHELKTQSTEKSPLDAFNSTVGLLKGSWALAVIMTGHDSIMVARNGAPLIIGRGNMKICVSSDVLPFYGGCSEVAYLNDGDVLSISIDSITCPESKQTPVFEPLEGVYEPEDAGVYDDLMLKEIFDQPISLSNALSGRISADGLSAELSGFSLTPDEMRKLSQINLVACGTAYYAAKIGVHFIQRITSVKAQAFRASEFPSRNVCDSSTLTIGISQSGETKDTLDALQEARLSGSKIASLCNVIGSTIPRFTKNGAYLYAGPEYAVASTKAFTNMVSILLLLSITISSIPESKRRNIVQELRELPNRISQNLREEDGSVEKAVRILEDANSAIFIGRGISSPLSEEGALKMMEVAYLPCLAYPGGELKHGPIALIEPGTPVIAIAPTDETFHLMESSIRECKSRGAKIILITDDEEHLLHFADVVLQTPKTCPEISTIINTIPLQLMAYYLAKSKGLNADRPRNLAKSVTVV